MDRSVFDATYGWLDEGARDALWEAYIETGDPIAMWTMVRQDPRYGQWFPGNLSEDGRPILPEEDYARIVAGYDEVFRSVGLNPDLFHDRYGELIAGDVSPQELESERIYPVYERIVDRAPEIREYYADMHGIPMTNEAILASYLDPDIETKVLNRQITMAEIGGSAAGRGYDLSQQFVQMLYEQGMDWEQAQRLFGSANSMLPMLRGLATRHGDPDDEFDITEFVEGAYLQDPEQIARISRLTAQEKSTFTGGAQLDYRRSQETGGVAGLEVR
jgi:hypothetical protein